LIRSNGLLLSDASGMGPSLKDLVIARGFAPCQLRMWQLHLDSLIQQPNLMKGTLNIGRHSKLAPTKERLLMWLSNMRQDGVPVSIKMHTVRTTHMLPGEKAPHEIYDPKPR